MNEQIKAIHKELGRKDDKADFDELRKKIEEAGMTEEAKDKALQEMARLEAMPPMSAESTVSRTYIDWLINVPWKTSSEEINDLNEAEKVLNEDHLKVMRNTVRWASNEAPMLQVDGPGLLDVTMWSNAAATTIHLVNLTNPMAMKGPYRDFFPPA